MLASKDQRSHCVSTKGLTPASPTFKFIALGKRPAKALRQRERAAARLSLSEKRRRARRPVSALRQCERTAARLNRIDKRTLEGTRKALRQYGRTAVRSSVSELTFRAQEGDGRSGRELSTRRIALLLPTRHYARISNDNGARSTLHRQTTMATPTGGSLSSPEAQSESIEQHSKTIPDSFERGAD